MTQTTVTSLIMDSMGQSLTSVEKGDPITHGIIYGKVFGGAIAGSVSYHRKANIPLKQVTQSFGFPSAHKSYIYSIL